MKFCGYNSFLDWLLTRREKNIMSCDLLLHISKGICIQKKRHSPWPQVWLILLIWTNGHIVFEKTHQDFSIIQWDRIRYKIIQKIYDFMIEKKFFFHPMILRNVYFSFYLELPHYACYCYQQFREWNTNKRIPYFAAALKNHHNKFGITEFESAPESILHCMCLSRMSSHMSKHLYYKVYTVEVLL